MLKIPNHIIRLLFIGSAVLATSVAGYGIYRISKLPPPQTSNCAIDWQEYSNEKLGFKFKIPTGWTDVSIEERQSETLVYRSIISTTRPEEQMDPSYKISRFEVLASTSDLKTSSDYSRWFDNATGNQVKSTVEFKGLTGVEKYVDETETACGSQVEEKMINCSHRFEMYYFKKGNVYYLLSAGIYRTAELKEKNEAALNCFLENFQFKTN